MSKKGNDGTTGKRESLVWTGRMDDAFIQAILKEKDNGNRIDGTFTTHAYTNMVNELSKSLNIEFKKDHLKNRLKTLKEHLSQCYDMFRGVSLSGFSWNPNTKLIEAEDEVWEALIKEKPEAEKWRTKQLAHYDEMLELFAKDRASGVAAETAKERRNRMNKSDQRYETIHDIDQSLETNEIILETFKAGETTPPSQVKLRDKLSSKRKKRKSEKLEEENAFASTVMSSINTVAQVLDRNTKVMESSRPHIYSEMEIYKELELMCLEPDDIASAYLFLVEHPEKARALLGCPLLMRMTISDKMMNASP